MLFLEDFEQGSMHWTPGRTLTEADVMAFAGLSGDYNPAHTDYEFARKSAFGRPIAHGLLALVVSAGLADRDGSLDGSAIALLGVNWKFSRPVFFGDTIRLKLSIESSRTTSKPDRGIVVRHVSVYNQHDEIVQEGAFTTMVKRRPVQMETSA